MNSYLGQGLGRVRLGGIHRGAFVRDWYGKGKVSLAVGQPTLSKEFLKDIKDSDLLIFKSSVFIPVLYMENDKVCFSVKCCNILNRPSVI